MTIQSNRSREGLLIIVSGPSGVGKDEVVNRLRQNDPSREFVVTSTTRGIRCDDQGKPTEVHGRDYLFETKEEFEGGIKNGEFVEYAVVYGECKGLRKKSLEKAVKQQMILRVDPTAATTYEVTLRKNAPEIAEEIIPRILKVYIGTPSLWTLVQHRRGRDGHHIDEKIIARLKEDWAVWNRIKDKFNGEVVINHEGKLGDTVLQVEELIARRLYCR